MTRLAIRRKGAWRTLFCLGAPLLAAGCVVGPDYHRPALEPGDGYGVVVDTPNEASRNPRLSTTMDIPGAWWSIFHNAELNALVAEALRNNPSVEAAQAALRAAREQARAQQGAYFPSISASMTPSRQRSASNLASPLQSGASLYDLTTTQVSVSYAPDLFGANRRSVEALVAQADQQRFQMEATRLTLATNVVQSVILDAALRDEIDTTNAIIADQRETLASFRRQFTAGEISQADLAAQETQLAQTQATLPPLQKQFRINRDLLDALVGRTPGRPVTIALTLDSLSQPSALPLSLPADLVEHRPDVRIAEAQLHAACAEVGVAIAARLPNIEITANAGSTAPGLAPRFDSFSNFWAVAATIAQPIFEGGTLLHRQRAAQASYEGAIATYRSTVVGAFQNTADTLHALSTDADGQADAKAAADAARRGLEIARRQQALGDISHLQLLAAEQADGQARIALLQAEVARYQDVAALFQSLGGGWWKDAATTAGAH